MGCLHKVVGLGQGQSADRQTRIKVLSCVTWILTSYCRSISVWIISVPY